MQLLKHLKLGDYLIIAVVVILSFLPFKLLMSGQTTSSDATIIAVIRVNNKTVKKINLDHDTIWRFNRNGEENTVQVKNHQIRVIEANCKDQLCVKQGWKDEVGQTIVCLPHKFLIELRNGANAKISSHKKFDHTLVNP